MVNRKSAHVGILGGLSGSSLLFRTSPDLLAEVAGQWDLLLTAFVFMSDYLGVFVVLGFIATWLLYAHLVYLVVPKLYPSEAKPIVSEPPFRILVALWALLITAFLLYLPGLLLQGRIYSPLFLLFGVTLIPNLMIYYVTKRAGRVEEVYGPIFEQPFYEVEWDYGPPPPEIQTLLDAGSKYEEFSPNESGEDAGDAYERMWEKAMFILLFPTATTGVIVFVCFLLSPLPELTLFGGLIVMKLEERTPGESDSGVAAYATRLTERSVDIEYRLLANVGPLISDVKSRIALIHVVVGAALSSFLFGVGLQLLGRTPWETVKPLSIRTGTVGLLLLLAGLFGFWYWLRILLRLPAFGAWWNQERPDGERERALTPGPSDHGRSLPVRPVGYLLPSSLLALLAVFVWQWQPADEQFYLVASLLGVGLFGVALGLTVRTDSQSSDTDSYAVPFGWMIQFVGTAIVFVTFVAPDTPVLIVLLLVIIAPRWFYAVDLHEYTRGQSTPEKYTAADVCLPLFCSWYWIGLLLASVFVVSGVWFLEVLLGVLAFNDAHIAVKMYGHNGGRAST